MNRDSRIDRRSECGARGNAAHTWLLGTVALLSSIAHADNFAGVAYSARTDQLVVTMAYRGTNPNHTFSLKWGPCAARAGGNVVFAEVLDDQWQDAAQSDFKKTTRFDLTDMPCRPARLTLRTAPRFYAAVNIPVKAASAP